MSCIYFDILILPEHHCLPNETFELENFKIFQNNRPTLTEGARRGSGGIAIALNNSLFETHILLSVIKGVDGQISVKLQNNSTDFKIGILGLYLPPENYIYGKDPETFFNEAGVMWEDLIDCDLIVGGGDINARTRDMIDYLPEIDGNLIPARQNPDKTKNSHANSFITFLKDFRSIILNGRVTPEFNNYTFVNPRGCSVPDYFFSPVDHLTFCREMRTVLMSDVVKLLNIDPPRCLPDHSLLLGTFKTSFFGKSHETSLPSCFNPEKNKTKMTESTRPKKKNLKKMPANFFMSEEIRTKVFDTITRIEASQSSQIEINNLWSTIKTLFSTELNKLPNIPVSSNNKQRKLFRKSQPFWNPDLEALWKSTCQVEKKYLNFKVVSRTDQFKKAQLRNDFKSAQKLFDKTFRQVQRKYKKRSQLELERNAKQNPTDMWSSLKKLNNPPSSKAALEIVRADDSISHDLKEILERWLQDISNLFSGVHENPEMAFNNGFYDEILNKKEEFENMSTEQQDATNQFETGSLNCEISFKEVSDAIDSTKLKKAYLDIPNEAMKNENAKQILHRFFNLCFKSGLSPFDWNLSDIKPIPKKDKDPRDPLQNRCITIMCCVAKIYSKILNKRIQIFLEKNNILVDEQNGFRACRSCIDHIFVLCTVLRNRKLQGKDTFICYIDYKKAFDSVERNLLLFKLSQIGITGNMYLAISSMYSNPKSRVILNEHETEYFDCPIGVKQGDCLSPALFAIFINDLATEIKESNIGVLLEEGLLINILLYADDIVLLAENEEDMQSLLFIVQCWCKKWQLEVNLTKTNIMHIRPKRKKQSNFLFLFNMQPVQYCKSYKYLGASFNEHLEYTFTTGCLADSAGRALGLIVTKMIKNQGFPFNVYSILYESCVSSISDYAGEVVGYTQSEQSVKLQARAIRAYLGLPKNSCNVGVLSEVDWLLPEYRTRIKMIRQYNRILKMDDGRLTKKVYKWDRLLNDSNAVFSWSNEVKATFYSCGLNAIFDNNTPFQLKLTIDTIKSKFISDQLEYLKHECEQQTKLRTFNQFKEYGPVPAYITKPLSFFQRKHIARLRLGVLQIRIESGRYSRPRVEVNERICPICSERRIQQGLEPEIESEIHFLIFCDKYSILREKLFSTLNKPATFEMLDESTKLSILSNQPENCKPTAQFIADAFSMRSKLINKV